MEKFLAFVKDNWGALIIVLVAVLTTLSESDLVKDNPTATTIVVGLLAFGRILVRYITGVALTKK